MRKQASTPYIFHSITELNKALALPEPTHPLIALNDHKDIRGDVADIATRGLMMNFYKITYQPPMGGRIRYGQHFYDFNNGGLTFISPLQLVAEAADSPEECGGGGLTLLIHPDLFKGHPLAEQIKKYGFFSYNVDETLQLSEREKDTIMGVFQNIQDELHQRLDLFSQDILISHIELLLNYSNRFYNRQFITRQAANNDLLSRMEKLLDAWFDEDNGLHKGLPTVQLLAEGLHVSAGYLSDMLRSLTGMNAQQHIHQKLIEKAKIYLTTGNLSVAEVAYRLGFEHPQSFNKLFRNKTSQSPMAFKRSMS